MTDFFQLERLKHMAVEWKAAVVSGLILSFPIHLVETYVFSDWQFIGSLIVLVILDTVTGVWKHWHKGTISSRGFGEFCKKLILYGCVLIVTHTLISFRVRGEVNVIFGWIDTVVYSAILCREALSILENVSAIYPNLLPKWLLKRFKDFDATGELKQPNP